MASGAAFFDLDRTVLRGASGPVINQALSKAGFTRGASLPGKDFMFAVYDLFGETLTSMLLARAAALAARGVSVASVRQAGKDAADALEALVCPYVGPLLDDHRRAGRPVVLATTTPFDLVAPLAERLGFDDVVATQWSHRAGKYTGGIHGDFVWAFGKLNAVRRWARDERISIRDSFAYSDSVYDVPLLMAVGYPFAVNPDPRLWALTLIARWPVLFLDASPGVVKLAGIEPSDLLKLFARPEFLPFARFDIGPVDNIPKTGPAIVVANHRSYFDAAVLGITVARSGRRMRFMGKKEVFEAPVIGPLARIMGGIPVDRGTGSPRPLREAERVLEAGELVMILPQATIPRGRAFFDPVLKGKTGAARLAAKTGAPVVPIGVWGTERVWPRSSRIPHVANVLMPPWVRVRVGPPVELAYDDPDEDTVRIMEAIGELLPNEARVRHEPTAEELALTYPPGLEPRSDGRATRASVTSPSSKSSSASSTKPTR